MLTLCAIDFSAYLFPLLCDSFNVTSEMSLHFGQLTKHLCVGPRRIHLFYGHAKCRMVMDELRVVIHHCKILAKDCFVDHNDIS